VITGDIERRDSAISRTLSNWDTFWVDSEKEIDIAKAVARFRSRTSGLVAGS